MLHISFKMDAILIQHLIVDSIAIALFLLLSIVFIVSPTDTITLGSSKVLSVKYSICNSYTQKQVCFKLYKLSLQIWYFSDEKIDISASVARK